MKLARIFAGLLLSGLLARGQTPADSSASAIKWESWSPEVFARAKKERRFVLLDLEAVWCHWCHVMDEQTYANPEVIALVNSNYIAVRVDQDSRPDLANRYEDYGWPATIVFNSDGGEIVKRSGFLPPDEMSSMLKAINADPSPGPSVVAPAKIHFAANGDLSPDLHDELQKKFMAGYDFQRGAWGGPHKFLDWDGVEYLMLRAQGDDAQARQMARQTLDAQLKLLDPVWGGVYQYSTDGDWDHPHFEKIMPMQAENLRIYAQASVQFRELEYLSAATRIHDYLRDFLTSPDGAFYTSQDADLVPGEHSADYFKLDDAGRRKLGVPRVDQHIYARENGLAINALLSLYDATGNQVFLAEATRAADWIFAHRLLRGGGFKHDAVDAAGPYLGDSLYMARACLHFYASTGNRLWLERAEAATRFINQHFRDQTAGFATAEAAPRSGHAPSPQWDENVVLARTANLLSHYTGKDEYHALAQNAMRFLAAPEVARGRFAHVAGILLADHELNSRPLHDTVVGLKADPLAKALFQAAIRFPLSYKQTEWWDGHGEPLPDALEFPHLATAAAYLCGPRSCSAPVSQPADLEKLLTKFGRAAAAEPPPSP